MPRSALREVEVVVTRLSAAVPPGHEAALSAAERARAARFLHERDRGRYVASHAKLRELLAERAGSPGAALRIEAGRDGKPRVGGFAVEFSLSRSEGIAAYAFACGLSVGIDVEAIRPIPDADAIAALVFPRCERLAYAALAPRDRTQGFLRGWTRTEALAKALGCGLDLAVLEEALGADWGVASFTPAPGFAGAVACGGGGRP